MGGKSPRICDFLSRNTPAVILAAGSSSRLGQPKALVNFGDETLTARALRMLHRMQCEPIIVVTRQELLIDVVLEAQNSAVVVNPNPEAGRTGSLQVGLMALIGDKGRIPRRVLVVPVDRCGWEEKTIEVLLEQDENCSPNPAGHPLLLFDIEAVLASDPAQPLREIVAFKKIDAPGIHLNIDHPADLELIR